jgi:glycerol-3-phosphate dehydrogenase
LLVAGHTSEIAELEALRARGASNGATSLEMVDVNFVRRKEPHVHAVAAIWSPDTGIVEAEALIGALARLCRDHEVAMLVGTAVVGASAANGGIELVTPHERFVAHTVVNAAGLYADEISAMVGGTRFQIKPCRGEYAELAPAKRGLVNGLVYPLPHADGSGLGVHLTRTTWGSVLIGPTAQFQESKDDYEGARLPLEAFLEPTRALLPNITLADLQPGGTGIRAKLHGPNDKFADFLIERDSQNPNVIQVAGIESPGLTSCLAIGDMVAGLWSDQ